MALLGAVLASETEAGGLALRWSDWLLPAGAAFLLSTLVFRFPRTAGLPALSFLGGFLWWGSVQLEPFTPATGAVAALVVQPMSDRDLVTVFQKRVDRLELPALPLVPRLFYRVRDGEGAPPESWWTAAEALGWAQSSGAPIPEPALRFGLYRLELAQEPPVWRPIHSVLEGPNP